MKPVWQTMVVEATARIQARGGWGTGDAFDAIAAEIVASGGRDRFVNSAARGRRTINTQRADVLAAVLRISPDPKGRRVRRKPAPGAPEGPECLPLAPGEAPAEIVVSWAIWRRFWAWFWATPNAQGVAIFLAVLAALAAVVALSRAVGSLVSV